MKVLHQSILVTLVTLNTLLVVAEFPVLSPIVNEVESAAGSFGLGSIGLGAIGLGAPDIGAGEGATGVGAVEGATGLGAVEGATGDYQYQYKDCKSLLGCLDTGYDCYGGKCQPPRPGIDCVAGGSVPSTTSGPKKCCEPYEVLEPGKPCSLRKIEAPIEDPNRGKTGSKCSSVLDCFGTWDYCIDNICQPKKAGKDCVAEGDMPTSKTGSGSCCPPLATTLGVKCHYPDTNRCDRDSICTGRFLGKLGKCCKPGTEKSYCVHYKDKCY
ncbi:hypothetical protein BC940DRAFT_346405 [Gongronella butleri]|nr:hypothetical protein BC940DRAFT_346405 [Gongronella butleri]